MAKEKKKKSKLKLIIIGILLALSTIILVLVYFSPHIVAVYHYKDVANTKLESIGDELFTKSVGSVVYDKNDKEIFSFKSEDESYYINYSELSDIAKYAFIVLVDDEFYEKKGAKLAKLITLVRDERLADKEVDGVSNVTRDVAREYVLYKDVDKNNSLIEVFVANSLEEKYTKEQIYEYYINNLYFYDGYYGAPAAARAYFSKELSECSVTEIAYLAAMAENPTLNPDNEDDAKELLIRRNVAIDKLYGLDVIEKNEYLVGLSDIVKIDERKAKEYNYIESFIVRDSIRRLMESDGFVFQYQFENETDKVNYEIAYESMYTGYYHALFRNGYRIYTSFDMDAVDKLNAISNENYSADNYIRADGEYALNGGVVVIDNSNNMIVALVGGRSVQDSGYVYNRAFENYTMLGKVSWPESIYIPFIAWHHNLDYVLYGKEAVDGTLINKVTLEEAIRSKRLDLALEMYSLVTPKYSLSLLQRAGITKANVASTQVEALGSISATPVETSGLIACLAKDGEYTPVSAIRMINAKNGSNIYTRSANVENIFAANDVRIMTNILADDMLEEGAYSRYAPDNAYTAAVVDGGLFTGFSNNYTVVAVTNYEGVSEKEYPLDKRVNVTNVSGKIFKEMMEYLHKDIDKTEFEKPGPYSRELEPLEKELETTTPRPSLGGEGGHPNDGDASLHAY